MPQTFVCFNRVNRKVGLRGEGILEVSVLAEPTLVAQEGLKVFIVNVWEDIGYSGNLDALCNLVGKGREAYFCIACIGMHFHDSACICHAYR